jgi:hypothetical protein
VVAITSVGAGAAQAQGTGEPIYTIDGREHPELLPEWLIWNSAFDEIAHSLSLPAREAREEHVRRLSRSMLYIPTDDARICLEVAESILEQVDAEVYRPIGEAIARELVAPPPPGWYDQQYAKRNLILLQGRDLLKLRLPNRSFRAVTRWIRREVVPTLDTELRREDLPANAPLHDLPMRREGENQP